MKCPRKQNQTVRPLRCQQVAVDNVKQQFNNGVYFLETYGKFEYFVDFLTCFYFYFRYNLR